MENMELYISWNSRENIHVIMKWNFVRADFVTRHTVLCDRIIRYIIRYSGMKFSILVVSLVLVVAFMVTAGCTQNATPPVTPTPTASPVATTVQTPAPVVTTPRVGMGTPGPTEMLPVDYMLDFMVQGNGDTANPYMAVTLRGGNGMNLDSRVDITFTKPDGTTQSDVMLPPFHVGDFKSFQCSTDKNRVEIWVTAPTVGKVKTYDQIVPFKSINP